MLCDILPPREILDVLHEAEAAGIVVPKEVDEWWEKQTVIDASNAEAKEKEVSSWVKKRLLITKGS